MCSIVGSTCRPWHYCSGTYVCNVAGLFVQEHMPIMLNACMPVLVVTFMIAVSSYEVYIPKRCLISAHRVVGTCGIYVTFWEYICCGHICDNNKVIKSYNLLGFLFWTYMCSNVRSTCNLWYQCSEICMCNVVGIFVQGIMPTIWNLHITIPLVILLVAFEFIEDVK